MLSVVDYLHLLPVLSKFGVYQTHQLQYRPLLEMDRQQYRLVLHLIMAVKLFWIIVSLHHLVVLLQLDLDHLLLSLV
jgi:hypothetical protein